MSHPRPFRFGLLGENVRSAKELVDTAHRAEEAGFATFLLRDHFIAEPFGHQLAPLAALATVAAATTRLRVGTMVLCNDYRHPVLLAKEVATLDLLSDGRFELGLGAGFSRPEYEAAGLPYDPAGVRVDRLAEALQVLKGLFGATPCTFAGPSQCSSPIRPYWSAREAGGCLRSRRARPTSSVSKPPPWARAGSRQTHPDSWRRPLQRRSDGCARRPAPASTRSS